MCLAWYDILFAPIIIQRGREMFPHCNIKEDALSSFLRDVDKSAVRAALESETVSFTGFVTLLSDAAAEMLPEIREKAALSRRMHFGRAVRLYAPIYVSNYCVNNCVYCGFRTSHQSKRKRLSVPEAEREFEAIKALGMDSLLVVSGEDPKITVEYLADIIARARKLFSYVGIEIYPLEEAGYRKLFEAGAHGLTVYQETYDRPLYKKLHLAGPKTDYDSRLEAPGRGARAGFYNLGLGALLGLHDWRAEAVSLAAHALRLRKLYWKSKVQFSFPRITPAAEGFKVPSPVSEDELERMMLAFRVFFPESEIYLSTRENNAFRKKMIPSCVTHMSAGSRVEPGGYTAARAADELGQFSVIDKSPVEAVAEDIESMGFEAVFKDWDAALGA
jgi:2-iminoacetate synthase